MLCIGDFRQRDSTKGDQCPQGELEQHGGTSTGRAGGLQSKKSYVMCKGLAGSEIKLVYALAAVEALHVWE